MVTGVILAAGQGRRMGRPKQLLPLGGEAMVFHVARTVCQANFDQVMVITGAYDAEVKQAVQNLPLQVIHNEEWQQGQAMSVKKAVRAISDQEGAVVFFLADQPLVSVELINEIIEIYHQTKASIVMPRVFQKPGNPVLFALKDWRTGLLQLAGDEGARQIIKKNQGLIHYLELVDEQIFFDVDTPEEYEIMEKIWQLRNASSEQ